MARARLLTGSGLLLVAAMAIVLAFQLVNSAPAKNQGGRTRAGVAPTASSASATVTAALDAAPTTVPTVAVDSIAQDALTFTLANVNIKSGQPQVALSLPVTGEALNSLGFGAWTFEQGCEIPMQVVIVKGDFDVQPAMPASIPDGQGLPAKYIVYVYDVRIREYIAMFGDPTGALVKYALGDPTLPDPAPSGTGNPTFPMPIPCDPTPKQVPGATGEDLNSLLTPTP